MFPNLGSLGYLKVANMVISGYICKIHCIH